MSDIQEEKIIDVGNEEFIDSEEWKDNFLKQGKWIRPVSYTHLRAHET